MYVIGAAQLFGKNNGNASLELAKINTGNRRS